MSGRALVSASIFVLLLTPAVARAQVAPAVGAGETAVPALSAPTLDDVIVPITDRDLARIRKALDSDTTIKIDDSQLRYYVQILAKQRTFAEYVKGYDLVNGPTRGGNPMTHGEFLQMVTPRELYSQGGITALDQLQFAFTNWLGQFLVKKAIQDLQGARSQNEVDAIRDRIDQELALLRRAPSN